MEYLIKEFIIEEERSFLRHVVVIKNSESEELYLKSKKEGYDEAVEWAEFIGGIMEIWERDEYFQETLIYINKIGRI